MSESSPTPTGDEALPVNGPLLLRSAIGGLLMGLANLVPGISGGTMLLATGVYTRFVDAIAELTTFRFRLPSILVLGTLAATAAGAILLLAGPTKNLVVEQRWIMYSLFIGLTLGGVPLVWRMARPATPALWMGAAVAFILMVAMAVSGGVGGDSEASTTLLVVAGIAGAAAMVLPGISGGYLLILLGQYEPILGAIDSLKRGLLAQGGPDPGLVVDALTVVIPVGIGVAVGVVGASNLIHWLLQRFRTPTLGMLLGLLLGSVVGLWPFQEGVAPEPGDRIKGRDVTEETAGQIDAEDWLVRRFTPSPGQVAAALALVGLGLGTTLAISRLGSDEPDLS